jgi:hypothetical protein
MILPGQNSTPNQLEGRALEEVAGQLLGCGMGASTVTAVGIRNDSARMGPSGRHPRWMRLELLRPIAARESDPLKR